jgi:hypothetical protein
MQKTGRFNLSDMAYIIERKHRLMSSPTTASTRSPAANADAGIPPAAAAPTPK